jgi:hypothetical protein
MRLLALISAALAFVALLGARFLPQELWLSALYCVPLFATAAAASVAAAALEFLLGAAFRPAGSAIAVALALFACLHSVFEGPPGLLTAGLPLEHVGANALSICALGAALVAPAIAWGSLRATQPFARSAAAAATGACLYALGTTVGGLGGPSFSPFALGLLGLGSALWLSAERPSRRPD